MRLWGYKCAKLAFQSIDQRSYKNHVALHVLQVILRSILNDNVFKLGVIRLQNVILITKLSLFCWQYFL